MKTSLFVMGFLCLVVFSCGSANENYSATDSTGIDELPTSQSDEKEFVPPADTSGFTVYNGTNPTYDWDKKIIKTANIQTECKDYKAYNLQVHVLAKQFGGWIASESEVQHSDRINNNISIKVPVPQFEDLLNAVGNLDAKTIEKRINSEDVTGKIIDVQGRIQVKKEIRDKYLDMLHRTSKIEDALKVQSELNTMHENIEMASTYVASLKNKVSYSTINLSYFQLMEVPVVIAKSGEPGFGARVMTAAANGGSWILEIAVGLVSIWPLILGLGLLVFYLKRKKLFRDKKPVTNG